MKSLLLIPLVIVTVIAVPVACLADACCWLEKILRHEAERLIRDYEGIDE